jgi:hypothetical protein
VPDSTDEAIDRFFNFIDNGVEKLDHAFNRGKQVEEKHHTRRTKRPEVIEAEATVKPVKPAKKSSSSTTAIARKPNFRIVESITESGTIYVVTDGGNARTECSTRSFAEQVLRALEGSS